MILSSPFSRHNRSHQTWHSHNATSAHRSSQTANGHTTNISASAHRNHPNYNTSSLRKPAPQQPAPQRPQHHQTNGINSNNHMTMNGYVQQQQQQQQQQHHDNFRSSTLNRLDLLRARQARQPVRRNLSSLGHYPALVNGRHQESGEPVAAPLMPNGHARLVTATRDTPIYAPASIASPRELAPYPNHHTKAFYYNQPNSHNQQQHYAATSVRGDHSAIGQQTSITSRTASAQPGARTGRESALSNILGKFDTLKRKARRHWPTIGSSSSRSSSRLGGVKLLSSNGVYATPDGQQDNRDEAELIYAEGLQAIDGNGQRRSLEHELEPELMQEGETRTVIDEESMRQLDYIELVNMLTGWINDELAEQRIIVRDLREDLYDGQVLCKLIERLHGLKLDIVDVTQNELAQRHKLKTVLGTLNRILSLQARWARIRWTVDGIHGKNLVEIIHLLVTLALFYKAPIRMPANVQVGVFVFQKYQDQLIKRSHRAQLTDELVAATLDLNHNPLQANQRDAFDLLIECAPEKLGVVKQSLVRFCNRHLNKINMSCCSPHATNSATDLEPNQFSDGLLFVFLISSLEDFFVPLGNLFTTIKRENITQRHHHQHHQHHQHHPLHHDRSVFSPSSQLPFIDTNNNNNHVETPNFYAKQGSADIVQTNLDDDQSLDQFLAIEQPTALEPSSYVNTQTIEKLHNVNVALQLIEEAGVTIRQRVRAEDVVNGDLKAVLRVLYALFSRYKHL